VRWNGGFLVYLVAFPSFVSRYFFLFEPKVPKPENPVASQPAEAFPMGAALAVGALTLFASVLYYVFIVNGSIAWHEVGLSDPMAISKATFVPSFFILAGSVLFRILSRYGNAVQIGGFLAMLGWDWPGSAWRTMCSRCRPR